MGMTLGERLIKDQIDATIVSWNKSKGVRDENMHLSTLIQPWFCYRQNILAVDYQQAVPEHDARLCSIFLHGWAIHELRQEQFLQELGEEQQQIFQDLLSIQQDVFWRDGIEQMAQDNFAGRMKQKYGLLLGDIGKLALECEQSHYYAPWRVAFTPDIIATLSIPGAGQQPVVVEIKGYNQAAYQKICNLANPMDHSEYRKAVMQATLYVHMLRELGLYPEMQYMVLLIENKNTQEYITKLHPFNPDYVKPYQAIIELWLAYLAVYRETGQLPKRVCETPTSEHAKTCPLVGACFAEKRERIHFLKKK